MRARVHQYEVPEPESVLESRHLHLRSTGKRFSY
jgi:hypothetical protein